MKWLSLILVFSVFINNVCAQESITRRNNFNQQDTLFGGEFDEFSIEASGEEYQKKYRRAKYFIRRVYPYAILASEMLLEYQAKLETMTSNHQKNKFLRQANKELKEEFGDEIRDLSVTRGKYLVKLIYRETGLSVYDIIKQYRGNVKAVFWQSLCVVNGQDLKATFDPKEDIIIERVVREIENGIIKVIPRTPKTEKGKEVEKRRKKRKKRNSNKYSVAKS